jgi:hypothetical protein
MVWTLDPANVKRTVSKKKQKTKTNKNKRLFPPDTRTSKIGQDEGGIEFRPIGIGVGDGDRGGVAHG